MSEGRGPLFPPIPVDDDWRVLHQKFHDALVGACGLKSLLDYREQIDLAQRPLSQAFFDRASDRDVAAEHAALTQAVLARDADRAVELDRGAIF